MTVYYKSKRRLTVQAQNAKNAEDALSHVICEAARVFGPGGFRLIECEITASEYVGNSYDVTATFQEGDAL